jgi:hypothetical protein
MSSNALVNSLSKGDIASLSPHLKGVQLNAKSILFEAGDQIPAVYFPVSAIISLVVTLSTGNARTCPRAGLRRQIGVQPDPTVR